LYEASQLLKVKEVGSILRVSPAYVWAKSKEVPEFPQPFKLSAKQTRWKLSDVDAYIRAMSTKH
jgi:predicted DNA-binding transcriptional regulator AlpA